MASHTFVTETNDMWSQDNAISLSSKLKENIKPLLDICKSERNVSANLEQMNAICALIKDMTGSLHKRLFEEDEPKAEFYETILQAAFDLDIHQFMFEKLKLCFVEAQDNDCVGSFPENQTGYKFDLSNKHLCKEMIEVCVEVLSLLAEGNLLQGKAVRNIGLTPYVEILAMRGFNTTVSCCAFKIVTAFMYDDEEYGKDVCQRSKYSDRANYLFRDENISISGKGNLVDFCICSLYFLYFMVSKPFFKWPVRIWISFGCHLIQCDDVFYQRKAVTLLHSIYYKINWHIPKQPNRKALLQASYAFSDNLVPLLMATLRSPDHMLVSTSLLTIHAILRRERDFNEDDYDSLAHCAVSNGFITHALAIFRSGNETVIENALLLLRQILEVDDIEALGLSLFKIIVPDLCAFVRSCDNFYITVRALKCINCMLNNIEHEELKQFACDFAEDNMEIVFALLECLGNIREVRSNWTDHDGGWVEHIDNIFQECTECLEYLITIAMEGVSDITRTLGGETAIGKLEEFKDACAEWNQRQRSKVTAQFCRLNDLFDYHNVKSGIYVDFECDDNMSNREDNPYDRYNDDSDVPTDNSSNESNDSD